MPEIEIPFPFGGLSDGERFSEQEPLTTREALNVRGYDPMTGRRRGARRPALTLETDVRAQLVAAGETITHPKIQDLRSLTYSLPKITYTIESTITATNEEWTRLAPSKNSVVWIETGDQNCAYVLEADGTVTKYNSDGEELWTHGFSASATDTIVPRLVVSKRLGTDGWVRMIYAAAVNEDGETSKIWRMENDEENDVVEAVVIDVDGAISDIAIYGDALYAVKENATGIRPWTMAAWIFASSGAPELAWEEEVAGPVVRMEVGPQGALYLAQPANLLRGGGAERDGATRQTPQDQLWDPTEITNAEQRIHAWVNTTSLSLADGDEIQLLPDVRPARFLAKGLTLADTYSRPLFSDTNADFTTSDGTTGAAGREGPAYKVNGVGGLPSAFFNPAIGGQGGQALWSKQNTSGTSYAAQKTVVGGGMASTRAMIPGNNDGHWACFIVCRPLRREAFNFFLAQNAVSNADGLPQDYGILCNSNFTGAGLGVCSDTPYGLSYDMSPVPAAGSGGGAGGEVDDGSFDNDAHAALITIVHNAGGVGTSCLRINGQIVDAWTGNANRTNYDGAATNGGRTILGQRWADLAGDATRDLYQAVAMGAFAGDFCELITVLGDHVAGVNDGDVENYIPTVTASASGYVHNGSCSQLAAAKDADFATEVERIEGHLAHKWGIAHLLPNGFCDAPSTVSTYAFANHPFGGTGHPPLSASATSVHLRRHDEYHHQGMLTKVTPGTGAFGWCIPGSGLGYSAGVDSAGDAIGYGPVHGLIATGAAHMGVGVEDDSAITARKIEDNGTVARVGKHAVGFIRLLALPADGETVTINDGGTTLVYEFDNDAAITGDVLVTIGGDVEATSVNLRNAINASGQIVIAEVSGWGTTRIRHTEYGSAYNEAIVSTASALIVGLQDGMDQGDAWISNDPTAPTAEGVCLRVDMDGDWYTVLGATVEKRHGASEDVPFPTYFGGDLIWTYTFGSEAGLLCNAVGPFITQPEYYDDTISGPEFIYAGSNGGSLSGQPDDLKKLRTVTAAQDISAGESPRATIGLCVIDGKIATFGAGTAALVTREPATLDHLAGDSPYVMSTELFGKVYWTDGISLRVYDPIKGEVKAFTSADSGEIPKYPKLICSWGGRLVLARTGDTPHALFMSQVADPARWDLEPAIITAIDAFSGDGSPLGQAPDIINALIPWSDDLLIVGCDHTIWRLTGDPVAGGRLDLYPGSTGMMFGRPWATDERGMVYFFGSRGGVYVMSPGSPPECISDKRLERRLRSVDASTHTVRMEWDTREGGLRIHVVPLGSSSTDEHSWFWDRSGAFWEDSWSSTSLQATALTVRDGDLPDDRVVLVGCADGKVRYFDESAVSDDGFAVDSQVLIGPIAPEDVGQEFRFSHWQAVLGASQGGCIAEVYATDTAEFKGTPLSMFFLGPGRNAAKLDRGRGAAVFVKLRSADVSNRWALESLRVRATPAGRKRVRS